MQKRCCLIIAEFASGPFPEQYQENHAVPPLPEAAATSELPRQLVVVLRAFGDLVIAAGSTAAIPGTGLLIGPHLSPLVEALAPRCPVYTLPYSEQRVPALFDVRKHGITEALISLMGLYQAFRQVALPVGAHLLLDRVTLRERLILPFGVTHRVLPAKASNIYAAYAEAVGPSPARPATMTAQATGQGLVGIFPGSRLPAKNLPIPVVEAAIRGALRVGHTPILYLLDGERPDLEAHFPNAVIVPRRFDAMLSAVAGVGHVVSADSMPAHMAEYLGRPVFVLSPIDNRFWLPGSSFNGNLWRLFDDCESSGTWLGGFLLKA
jgi:hypothetical protein